MENYEVINIKTLFSGKAWVHQKYLRKAEMLKAGIILVYKGKRMIIEPTKIKSEFWTKGKIRYEDKFSGEPYYLWGIDFLETLTN